ncbi:MAG: NAD-dependent epimerase/dehydratase family protein [Deltaproteobacteria bacterium]|nr:NAD-dependent epimerase/dehydratase family protein [Deltaproteobacteria bacterium]
MKVFITGGAGFLGRHLVGRLTALGHQVIAPSREEMDLTLSGSLDRLADNGADREYDQIYHLAVWTRSGSFCRRRGGEQWLANSAMDGEVLRWWWQRQPQAKLIALGTSGAYSPGLTDLREEDYLFGEPDESLFGYAMAKRSLYAGMRALGEQAGLRYLYLIPSSLYGLDYHQDGRDLHLVYDLAREVLRAARGGAPVVVWGDGHQRRELLPVADAVSWMLELADTVGGEIVNLATGEDHSIRDLVGQLCELAGHPFDRVEFDLSRSTGIRSRILDSTKIDALLPNRQKTLLRDGLAETLSWVAETLL